MLKDDIKTKFYLKKDTKERREFYKHMDENSFEVERWPKWKRNFVAGLDDEKESLVCTCPTCGGRIKYAVVVLYFKEEDYYLAYHPEFGHSACSATGKSVYCALNNLEKTTIDVIAHYKETGKEIPMPDCKKNDYIEMDTDRGFLP